MGWTVYKVYTDPGYSGASLNRPALQSLINASQRHSFQKVVVYKLDRLSRSQRDTLTLLEEVFNTNGVDFVSMNENFDTSTPFGRATIGILSVFAQLEREQIKERMKMGRAARAKSGKWMGSHFVPIGYDKCGDGLVVNEYEAMQVRKIFQMFTSGASIKSICKWLIDSGYSHKHGHWNDKAIRRVLLSKTYLGYVLFDGEWYQSDHDPIISEEIYKKAQDLLQERAERYATNLRPGKATSYLAGLLICKRCGAKYHRINGKYQSYYYCDSRSKRSPHLIRDPNCKNKNWRMDVLDEMIFDQIRQLSLDPDYVPEQEQVKDNSGILTQEIFHIDRQISRFLDLYGLDQLPMDQLQQKIAELSARKNQLEKQLKVPVKRVDRRDIVDLAKALSSGSFEEIREVLFELIDKIYLDGDDVEIHWKF